jgi:hypothetical protein
LPEKKQRRCAKAQRFTSQGREHESFTRKDPVTVLVDERGDGVHLTYDRMVSFLAPYGNSDALKVAQDLDLKVEKLMNEAAA